MNLRLFLAGVIGLVILGFNSHLVTGLKDDLVAPFKAWQKNPNDVKSPFVLESPDFPDNTGKRATAKKIPKTEYPLYEIDGKTYQVNGKKIYTLDGKRVTGIELPSGKKKQAAKVKPPAEPFGARAVGVQRARGL